MRNIDGFAFAKIHCKSHRAVTKLVYTLDRAAWLPRGHCTIVYTYNIIVAISLAVDRCNGTMTYLYAMNTWTSHSYTRLPRNRLDVSVQKDSMSHYWSLSRNILLFNGWSWLWHTRKRDRGMVRSCRAIYLLVNARPCPQVLGHL